METVLIITLTLHIVEDYLFRLLILWVQLVEELFKFFLLIWLDTVMSGAYEKMTRSSAKDL